MEYQLELIRVKYDLSDDAQKVEYLRECATLIATFESPVEREVYGARCAETADVSRDAMAQQVKRALDERLRRARKKQERKNLAPAAQLVPKERELRAGSARAGLAEEGIVRLVLLDPALFSLTGALEPEDFTAPYLGKAFGLLRGRWSEGRAVGLGVLAGELTPQETDRIAGILQRPEAPERAREALSDYVRIMETEAIKRTGESELDPLLAAREKYREKKGYGG